MEKVLSINYELDKLLERLIERSKPLLGFLLLLILSCPALHEQPITQQRVIILTDIESLLP